jgi:hypothetical protein
VIARSKSIDAFARHASSENPSKLSPARNFATVPPLLSPIASKSGWPYSDIGGAFEVEYDAEKEPTNET